MALRPQRRHGHAGAEQRCPGLCRRHHLGAAHAGRLRHAGSANLAEASAVFHLLRNIGSSFFISICRRRDRAHDRRQLQPHDRDGDALQSRAGDAGGDRRLGFDTVPGLAKVAKEITRQAAMIGYLNAFTMYTVWRKVKHQRPRLQHEPPASPYAIMRRVCPYRGENSGPGKDIVGKLDTQIRN